jgi:glycosyltransferase involved in cell wall biosynthesis
VAALFYLQPSPNDRSRGDAAIYINPDCPEEAAREIAKNLPNISKLKQAGLTNVQRFTPQRMLESYVKLYQEICQ